MNDTTDQPAPRKKMPAWHWALYAAFLAMTVCVALLVLQTHNATMSRRRTVQPHHGVQGTANAPPAVGGDLSDIISRSIRDGTLEPAEDPGGLAAPPRAVRRSAGRQETMGLVQEYARYEYPGTVEQGAAHYVNLLLDEGFTCHEDSRTAGGPVRLLFIKDKAHARVTLRKYSKDETITVIAFILLTDRNSNDTVKQSVEKD